MPFTIQKTRIPNGYVGQGPARPLTSDRKESLKIALQGQCFYRFKWKVPFFMARRLPGYIGWRMDRSTAKCTQNIWSISAKVFAWCIESIKGQISGKARLVYFCEQEPEFFSYLHGDIVCQNKRPWSKGSAEDETSFTAEPRTTKARLSEELIPKPHMRKIRTSILKIKLNI